MLSFYRFSRVQFIGKTNFGPIHKRRLSFAQLNDDRSDGPAIRECLISFYLIIENPSYISRRVSTTKFTIKRSSDPRFPAYSTDQNFCNGASF